MKHFYHYTSLRQLFPICLMLLSLSSQAQTNIFRANNKDYKKLNGDWYLLYQNNKIGYRVDPEVITIRFKDGISEAQKDSLHSSCESNAFRTNTLGFVDIRVQPEDDVTQILQLYISSGLCELAELNTFAVPFSCTANDTHFLNGNQWHLNAINMPAAWNIATGNPNVVVAIIEGFDPDHEDINSGTAPNDYSNVWINSGEVSANFQDDDGNGFIDDFRGWNFSGSTYSNGSGDFSQGNSYEHHGTAIAGIVAAKTSNSLGVAGIAGGCGPSEPGVQLMNVAFRNIFASSEIDDAICYAVDNNADIISVSFGFAPSNFLDAVLQAAADKGILVVVAAGNNGDFGGTPNPNSVTYPASSPLTLAVGATNMNNLRADFSSFGQELDIVAPGVNMFSTKSVNDYDFAPTIGGCMGCGTSLATPVVAGVGALMLSANPSLTPAGITEILKCTSTQIGPYTYTDGHSDEAGAGLIDAGAAVAAANSMFPDLTISGTNVWPTNRAVTNITIQSGGNLTILAEVSMQEGAQIVIESGAELIIDGGVITGCVGEFRDGLIHVFENGLLHMKNGGQIILGGSGTLLIDAIGTQKGKLRFDQNSVLFLNDDNTVFELQGRLEIGSNAEFTFNGSGFMRLNLTDATPNIVQAVNSKFKLVGNGKTDLVLQITNGSVNIPSALSDFRIISGKVEFLSKSAQLNILSNYVLNNVSFETNGFQSKGVQTFGQSGSAINYCNFFWTPLTAQQYLGSTSFSITNSTFEGFVGPKSLPSIMVFGGGFDLDNIIINQGNDGMFATVLEYPSTIKNSKIRNCERGLWLSNGSGGQVIASDFIIENNSKYGIYAQDVVMGLSCGELSSNGSFAQGGGGIRILDNTWLIMSSYLNTGYVEAINNWNTIISSNAYAMSLNIGNNALYTDNGLVAIGTLQIPNCLNPTLYAPTNQWDDMNPNASPLQSQYVLSNPIGGCPISIQDLSAGTPSACPVTPTDPCVVSPTPCKTMPIIECPTCPLLNTADFPGVPFNEAVQIARDNLEIVDPGQDDLVAIDLFHQILTSSPDLSDPDVNSLVHDSYVDMKNAIGNTFKTGKITEGDNTPSLHASVQQLIDVQDTLSADSITATNFREQFYLEMDKAHTMRLVGDRGAALQILNAIDNCFLTENEYRMRETRIQIFSAEQMVLTGVVEPERFTELISIDLLNDADAVTIQVDSTAIVDSTVTLGSGSTLGANTTIESGASIGDNTTIGGNVTIGQDVTIGTGSAIGDNTVIALGTSIGSGTAIGNNVTVAEKTVIGDNTTIGGYATVQEKTVIGSGVTIGAYTAVGEKAAISDGAALGESNMIGGKTAIGANVTTGDMVELGEKVMIGDATFVGTGTAVNGKTLIGAWVNVASSLNIGEKVQVCDSHTVATDVPDKAILCSPGVVSPPTLASAVVHDCAFALSTALVRGHFFNGFTAVSGGSDTLCTNRAVRFTPDAFSNATFWDFGDCATSTDAAPTHTYAGPGVYIIRLVQDFHCITDTLIGSVTVFPNPEPAFTLSASCDTLREVTVTGALPPGDLSAPGCFGQSPSCPSFTPLDTAMLRVKYRYDFGSGAFPPAEVYYSLTQAFSGASSAFTLAYPVDSAFEIALTATLQQFDVHDAVWKDMGSCAGTYTETLQTTGPVQAGVAAAAVACTGQPAAFESTVTGGYSPFTYTWDFGDGNTSTAQNPENTYSDPGSFTASLAVTDRDGCADTAYRNVEVTPSNITAGFYFEAQGLSVTFSDLSAGAAEFHWDFGDGFTSTLQNPVHEYAAPGDYTVCQAISNPCGADTFCLEVEVGATAFQKAYGGPGEEGGTCVINTSDGGFAALGYTGSFGAGNLDVSAIKTDGDGTILWSKAYGGSNLDDANSIRQTADGGYIIAGRTRSFGSALNKGLVIKTDANGDVQWSKVFTLPGNLFFSVVREVSGGYAIAGNTDVGAGGKNILFARLDSSGNPVFVKAIGGGGDQFCRHLQTTRDGGFLILGDTRAGSDIDVLVIKTDAAGTIQWSRSYSGILVDFGQSTEEIELLCTCDGGFVISGYTNSQGFGGNDGMMFKIDTLGGLLWSKTYGGAGDEHFATIKEELSTHSLITCGATTSFGSGQSDIYWVESDHNGNLLESGTYGGAGIEHSSSTDDIFQITPDGGVAIIGQTNSFGAGGNDAYFIKTDPGGASGCNEAAPVATQVAPASVAVSAVSLPVVNTSFATVGHALVVSGGATVETSICPQPQAKMGNTGGGKHMAGADDGDADEGDEADMASGSYLNAYPNPFGGKTTIEFMLPADGRVKLEVVNLAGERVALLFNAEAQAGSVYRVGFDAANAGAGFYFCTLSGDGIRITGKLVAVGRP